MTTFPAVLRAREIDRLVVDYRDAISALSDDIRALAYRFVSSIRAGGEPADTRAFPSSLARGRKFQETRRCDSLQNG
jgi:hypothetical protein